MLNRIAEFGGLPVASAPHPEYIDGRPVVHQAHDIYAVVHNACEFAKRYQAALQYADIMMHDPRQNPEAN